MLAIVAVLSFVVPMLTAAPAAAPASASISAPTGGSRSASAYWLVASDGGVFNYGGAGMYGSEGGRSLNKPIVGMAATPDGRGYWLVASDGGVFNYGDAAFTGSAGTVPLNRPIVGMATTPDGKGYWLVASDGGVFNYGDAAFIGSAGALSLNKPIVGMAATPDGKGYWLVASDGGVFNYGDAGMYGSEGGRPLNKPIVGMAATPDGKGYWLVASDGGVFNYGDAAFIGSAGALSLNKPIVGMAATPDGKGYWLVASDGGVFNYGDAAFTGSAGALFLNKPIVGMAAPSMTASSPARGLAGQGTPANGSVSPPPASPAITMEETANPTTVTAAGQTLTYAFGLKNTGNVMLTGVGVSDAQTSPSLGSSLGPITCTTGTNGSISLAPGVTDNCSAAYTVSQADMANATIKNVATTTGTPPSGPAVTATSPATVTASATQSGGMSAPAGYTNQQLMFDDQFAGTTLDTTKWTTSLGADGVVWNNFGKLPSPYSGTNTPGSDDLAMYAPSQVSVDNGLTLAAQRNTNQYAGAYPWLSGVVTTEGKFTLPTGGWYVQVKAKMPDQTRGMWPAIWFLCGPSCSHDNELDGYEGGWLMSSPNQIMHSDYFANQGQQQNAYNVGADVSAGYHVYGFRFIPGQSITAFFDGRQVWQVQASSRRHHHR